MTGLVKSDIFNIFMIFSKVRKSLICFLILALFFLTSNFLPAYAEEVPAASSTPLERGIQLINENKPDEAIKALEEAVLLEPKSPLPLYYLGTAYHLKHENVTAINFLNKAISIEPGMPLALLRTGIILEELGRLDLAASAYKTLSDKGGDSPQVKEAGERYKRVASIMYYKKGTRLYQEKRYEESIKELKASIAINPENADVQFAAGMTYQHIAKYNEAIEAFKKVVALTPSNTTALLLLGNLYKSMSMYEEAITTFKQIISIAPETSQAKEAEKGLPETEKRLEARKHFETAAEFIKTEKWQDALEETKIVLSAEEKNPNALFNLGLILYKLKDDEGAINALKKVIEVDPKFQKAFYQLGTIYEEENKYTEAVENYKQVKAIDDKSEEAGKAKERMDALKNFVEAEERIAGAKELLKKEDIEGSIKEIEGLISIKKDDPKLFLSVAMLYLKAGRAKDAVAAFEKASMFSPNDVEIRMLLAKGYEGLREYVKAIEVYKTIAEMERDKPRGKEADEKVKVLTVRHHLEEGRRYLSEGKYEASLQEMQEIIKITPDDPVVLFNTGVLYYRLNSPEQAEEPLTRAVELVPDYLAAQLQLGLVYERLRKFDDAQAAFEKVIGLQKGSREADVAKTRIGFLKETKELSLHLDTGIKLMEKRDWEGARKEMEAVLTINPKNYVGHYYKGMILFAAGLEDEAKAAFKKAIEIKPDFFQAYLRIGDIFMRENEFEEARKYYEQVVTSGKGTPEADIASDSLKRLKAWWLSLNMRHGYNTNIAFRSKAQSSLQTTYGLGLTYLFVRAKTWNLSSLLMSNKSVYYDSQLTGDSYSFQVNGNRKFSEDRSITGSSSLSKSFFLGKPTFLKKDISLVATTEPRAIPTSASLSYSGSIGKSYTNVLSNAEQHNIGLSVTQKLSVRDTLTGSYSFSIYKNLAFKGSNYANRANTVSLSYGRPLIPEVSLSLGYTASFVDYSNPDSTTIFQSYRKNVNQTMTSGLSFSLNEDVSITFSYNFSYAISRTNLPPLTAEEQQKLNDLLASPIPTVGGGGGYYQHNIGISISTMF